MNIIAFFTSEGTPATGLSPTIRVRNVATGALVVTDASMTETGDGFYKYDFTAYDSTVDYAIRCDGTASLPAAERYVYGGNDSYTDDVAQATWSAQLSAYGDTGTAGLTQRLTHFRESVTIDVANGYAGTTWPIGTHNHPVNNIDDALTIATANNIDTFYLHGPLTIEATDNVNGYRFEGHAGWGSAITFTDGCSANETSYKYMALDGEVTPGDVLLVESCTVGELLNFSGVMNVVQFSQGAEISISTWANIIEGSAGGEPTNEPEISLNSAMATITKYTGNIKLANKAADNRTTVELAGGNIIFDSTCVSGTVQMLGHGYIEADNSGPNCNIDTDGFLSEATISYGVWEEQVDEHATAGTTGRKLKDLASSVIYTGTAAGSGIGGNQIQFAAGASNVDGAYDPALVSIVSGLGVGQTRGIYQYDGATRTATVDRNWKQQPDITSEIIITAWPGREHVNEGLAQGGTTNTITLNTLASDFDDVYLGQSVFIRSGTGEDQVATVTAYNGTTKVATITPDWQVVPDTTSGYVMLPMRYLTADQTADAVWDESTADHTTLGTFGAELATKADLFASAQTTETTPITGFIVVGDNDSGAWTNVYARDSVYWVIGEDATNGLNVEFRFNLPSANHRPGLFRVFGRYIGTPSTTHFMDLWAYNFESMTFEQLVIPFMPGGVTSDDTFEHEYYERNIDRDNNNEVRIRIRHNITSPYNAAHQLYLDFVELTSILPITAEDIATAVWTKTLSGGETAETYLYYNNVYLKRALGLMHENIYIDNATYDSDNNLVGARVRIYSDSVSVGTSSNVIGTYQITSTGSGAGKFTNWKQIAI